MDEKKNSAVNSAPILVRLIKMLFSFYPVMLLSLIHIYTRTPFSCAGIPIPLAFLFQCFFDRKILQLPNEVIVFHFIILKSKAQRKRKP